MGAQLRRHFQSNVVGYIALFVAMSGSAYAVTNAPKNSVATKSIKNNAVTRSKIAKNAVTGRAVKDKSLTARDIDTTGFGSVPNSDHASTADNATNAANATNATNASNAANAQNAGNAQNAAHAADSDKLGGAGPEAFLKGAGQLPAGGDLTGAYAAPTIGQGRIGSGKIANGAILAEDIAPNTIGSGRITDGAIQGGDVANNTLGGQQINEASLGGVDAATLQGDTQFDFVRNGGNNALSAARNAVNTNTAAPNTVVLETSRYRLRTAGLNTFQVCSKVTVETYYVIQYAGTTTTQIVPSLACGTAFSASNPGSFTVFGPDAVMFGSPSVESTAVPANAARYSVLGIGLVVQAPS